MPVGTPAAVSAVRAANWCASLARLWPSGGWAKRVGNAAAQAWPEFLRVGGTDRGDETLFAPDFAADGSKRVRKGRALFTIPGGSGCGTAAPGMSRLPSRITRENTPSRQEVVRAMALSHHCRCVSTPRGPVFPLLPHPSCSGHDNQSSGPGCSFCLTGVFAHACKRAAFAADMPVVGVPAIWVRERVG